MIAAGALKQKQEGNAAVNTKSSAEVLWGIGELEFEAYMRMMDSAVSYTVFFNFRYSFPFQLSLALLLLM